MPAPHVHLPHYLKRCTRCGETKPRTEEFFYLYTPSSKTDKKYFFSRCKACGPAYFREVRAKILATNPERVRAKERAYRERLKADPERYATRLAYARDWRRRNRGTVAHRDQAPRGSVPAEPIRAAVERSGVNVTTISSGAGYEPSTVGKALKRETIRAAMAVRILEAIDVLPAEVDL